MSDSVPVPGEGLDSAEVWAELLTQADLSDDAYDENRTGVLIGVLQYRAEPRYVDLALPLLHDAVPGRRQMAAWLLGQYGYQEGRPFTDRVAPALAAAARVERDDDTRDSLVTALGFSENRSFAMELARYADDPYPPVRQAVARSLPSLFAGDDLDDEAVAVMITLTTDDDPEVRDWATFGLGTLCQLDSPDIRKALSARLDDEGGDTKFEATLGLACRGDDRVLPRLLHRLTVPDDGEVYRLDLESAAELADPSLVRALTALRERWRDDAADEHAVGLEWALKRCDPENAAQAGVLESELVTLIADELIDTGWSVTLSGRFPRTTAHFVGPGSSTDEQLVWQDATPAEFDPTRQARQWAAMALERTVSAPGETATRS